MDTEFYSFGAVIHSLFNKAIFIILHLICYSCWFSVNLKLGFPFVIPKAFLFICYTDIVTEVLSNSALLRNNKHIAKKHSSLKNMSPIGFFGIQITLNNNRHTHNFKMSCMIFNYCD
jgi:hypothetical protein